MLHQITAGCAIIVSGELGAYFKYLGTTMSDESDEQGAKTEQSRYS